MAKTFMDTRSANYTRTGDNIFTKLSNWASLIPFVGGALTPILGGAGALWDAGKWLLRGKPLSAATAFGAGVNGTIVNTAAAISPLYWGNLGSAVLTGRTIGTHARKLTEEGTSLVTRPLGMQPVVLRSYPAGIGSMGASRAPGRFASQVSNERGQNPQQAYSNYMRGEGGVHVNELGSAYGRGA